MKRLSWRRLSLFGGLTGSIALVLAVAIPAFAGSHGYRTTSDPFVALTADGGLDAGGEVIALVNSGEAPFGGEIFEGIPDGIGVVPGPGKKNKQGYVDLYVAHEQSHVPFRNFADFQDSSVSRVRVDLATKSITDLEVVLQPSEGFIRFCSAFMAGPEHGFPHYTFLLNEESNDELRVPAGASYGPDPSLTPNRQAGFAVYFDTVTKKSGVLASQGRHNHENNVIVPGGWRGIVALSGDDTFTFPSTAVRPNLSQLYMARSQNWKHFQKDESTLWAFRVTGTGGAPIVASDPGNGANDYLDMSTGDNWTGEFIPVPADVARGTTAKKPQDALEDWSNDNNAFQFVRVEDIAYDPDNPRVVYFADTGNSRLTPGFVDPPTNVVPTGRLYRGSAGTTSNGRIFKMVLNASDPTKVDEFSILADSADVGFVNPDNLDVGRNSIMVQEDPPTGARIWMYSFTSGTWSHVATATQPTAETSGIVDVSRWFGDGWWALDVQSHVNQLATDGTPFLWTGPPGPEQNHPYQKRRELGQLLLMKVPGS